MSERLYFILFYFIGIIQEFIIRTHCKTYWQVKVNHWSHCTLWGGKMRKHFTASKFGVFILFMCL
jgi:hypothetical protein